MITLNNLLRNFSEELQNDDLDAIYERMDSEMEIKQVTDYLLAADINPLEHVSTIYPKMYYFNDNQTSITIPLGISHIQHTAFWNCEKLQWIRLPNTIQAIDRSALGSCKSLKVIRYDGTFEEFSKIKIDKTAFLFDNNDVQVQFDDNAMSLKSVRDIFHLD